jgi:hypothetical protein
MFDYMYIQVFDYMYIQVSLIASKLGRYCIRLLTCEFLNSEYNVNNTCSDWTLVLWTGISKIAGKRKTSYVCVGCGGWKI